MIVLNEEELSLLFDEIARGFVHSPLEIFIFIILVIGFITSFLFIYVCQIKKSRIEKINRAKKKYEQIIKKKAFSCSEIDILDRLAKYLKVPQLKNLLLENQSTFNACVRKLQKEEHVSDATLSALRLKMGFKRQYPEQIPHSSAELAGDLPVLIVQKGKKQCLGRIIKSESRSITIALENQSMPLKPGLHIQIYFHYYSGLFSFHTSVQKYERGVIKITHSENIKRLQRRKFYRKELILPVYIKLAGSKDKPVRSTFIDLGGGGASICNTDKLFHANDDIELSFFTSIKAQINLTATVMRISKGSKILHVAFKQMPESSRDIIIGYLFRRKD